MKKGDYIIVALILLLSTGIFLVSKNSVVEAAEKEVVVSVNGKVEARYTLSEKEKLYTIDNKYGKNTFAITSDGVHMVESDCKDQICIHMGHITRAGESIICLPNRLIISLVNANADNDVKDTREVDVVLH
ncbi:MAG: NusG domain II-containing protein [Peptoniphilus sp.]|uniref:NusG domain II-containing protein n=1 Tax=Peptoniphilus sp. TaxID=1971214 RepID=UPI002A74D1AB|nr:NusG domain II-containing protein [Peptoniphilus sp.]MDY2987171.1 NusG domain II-containing protein [Peptoniphilus sp.]